VSDKTFLFEILTLQKSFLQQAVRFVIAPGQEGVFEILPDHAPFVFALKPGTLRIHAPDGKDSYVAIGSGFLIVQKERTTVLARSAERPEEIDAERARQAKERAEERLQMRASEIDVARAQAALQRALARLEVVKFHQGERIVSYSMGEKR
jgi:F-type H+-transporting ATPase subunit epsilon